ncbi:hypothetical protein [Streptomyces tibetensis]|uniref:hypothetical protein n=1 Tax=Streptomyces tibetensis TaxID=2382123 RepID=UPI0033E856B2
MTLRLNLEDAMAGSPPCPDADDDEGAPRWVKVSAAVAVVLVVVFVIVHLVGGGMHGHTP